VEGPSAGDIVLVSDEPVILALMARRRWMAASALEVGLIRLYGEPDKVAALESAIRRLGG
jgi:hypothetical protein